MRLAAGVRHGGCEVAEGCQFDDATRVARLEIFPANPVIDREGRKLQQIVRIFQARVLLVGIRSDWLFPPGDVRALADRLSSAGVEASYVEIDSTHGHDGFLADSDQLIPLMLPVLA